MYHESRSKGCNLANCAGWGVHWEIAFTDRHEKYICKKRGSILGNIIANGTICTDADKVRATLNFQYPKIVQLWPLGMRRWYKRFVQNNALLTTPLTNIVHKKRQFCYSEKLHSEILVHHYIYERLVPKNFEKKQDRVRFGFQYANYLQWINRFSENSIKLQGFNRFVH